MRQQQKVGMVVYFSLERGFGFINVREGNLLQKYFFHLARVIASEVDQQNIKLGFYARFLVGEKPPKRANDARYAEDVEIFIEDPRLSGGLAVLSESENTSTGGAA